MSGSSPEHDFGDNACDKYGDFDWRPAQQGLYYPDLEKDACGVGMVADIKGIASHKILESALQVLENLDHRGARGCEVDTGDGAGILCGMPDRFFRRVASELGVELPPFRRYAIGGVFLARDQDGCSRGKNIVQDVCASIPNLKFLAWRRVPVSSSCLGKTARAFEPHIEQCFIAAEGPLAEDQKRFEAALFVLRKKAANAAGHVPGLPFYICSLSSRVINYKGMLTCPGLIRYFDDLVEEDFETHVALVHSRFSTNTFPAWRRAHPFRYLCHNGEINTLKGNVNAINSREGLMSSEVVGPELQNCFPLVEEDQTDSGIFDNVLEMLTIAGRSLPEAVAIMMPQAWENLPDESPERRAFYKYHAAIMEPWDGPALVCFTDGDGVGASLDRNGLRPCRFYVTACNKLIISSECGVLPQYGPKDIVRKGRLSPGKMMWADFTEGRIVEDGELKERFATAKPYEQWLKSEAFMLPTRDPGSVPRREPCGEKRGPLLRAFGYHQEALDLLLAPMGNLGEEGLGSMGNDTPLACVSKQPRSVFDYFYQLFAQVTNPPIDPIRESVVMSVEAFIGPEENVLGEPTPLHCRRLWLSSPCLTEEDLTALVQVANSRGWHEVTLDCTFPVSDGTAGLEANLHRVCNEALTAVRNGSCQVLILSDRGVGPKRAQLPALLVCGAVHQALVSAKCRNRVALIIESGEPHEVVHHALLLTFGADAVCPFMAYEALVKLKQDGVLKYDEAKLFSNYCKAVSYGLLKIMAKMGISTLRSYRGAQIADAIGLGQEIVKTCFAGIKSALGGFGFEQVAARALEWHGRGYSQPAGEAIDCLPCEGQYHLRQGADAEKHVNSPMVIAKLQEAARTNSRGAYASFAELHNGLIKGTSLRGQLDFKPTREYGRSPLPVDAVEPATEIVKRFRTGAMSYGSISLEAHSTLAIAMNRMGGFSNTGEGGEDPFRYTPLPNGDSMKSAIKQVASGRFGVTMEYLSSAEELQIKMAQGAKPGEGGELPGHKVEPEIAKCRHSTAGVGLISPPPHHDIYSIEDLAQLIFDLKNANPDAGVSVKLVSEVGVGIVAAGVAKCKADHILISGSDGGTGASKWTGIKHAGGPWELGLAEAHQALVLNGLRGRVTLETDGQLRTGRDVIIAALLGAERYGFATAPLIAMGCIMMRKCHLNTCPVGVATQDPVLRKKFTGLPEHVCNYLLLVAEEARHLMARLGFRTFDELIGRADVLRPDENSKLQLGPIITPAHQLPDAGKIGRAEHRKRDAQQHFPPLSRLVDRRLVDEFKMTFRYGEASTCTYRGLRNTDRTLGTLLSHELFKRWGSSLPAATCHAKLFGTSGQSFGAFAVKGLYLELEGDSQDYFGKGLSGGALVVYPPQEALDAGFKAEENVIIGNTALYGATGGCCFVRGIAAERFGVRNSGAWAVVEGAGDHCCEYMTGGRAVVLGKVGVNFAAGMSGGVAWVWDTTGNLEGRAAPPGVSMARVDAAAPHKDYPNEHEDLLLLLREHVRLTGSTVAKGILDRWPASAPELIRALPNEYARAAREAEAKGLPSPLGSIKDFLPPTNTSATEPLPKRRRVPRKPEEKAPTSVSRSPAKAGMDIEDMGFYGKGQRPKVVDEAALVKSGTKGFLEYDRAEFVKRDKAERVSDFKEIMGKQDEDRIRTQAARCMDCGTPFCHQAETDRSGCPLGNLIPEWNELVRQGKWHQAFLRLQQTNNFPEFTGRVCPAPCEGACVLGIIDDPVSIKSVELTIIDKAYEMGWMKPKPPTQRTGKKVAIIGSGPAGLAAADQLNKMGHLVTVYERADRVGGLMMYGVPNMKADKIDVVQRRVDIMKKEGITFLTGPAGNVGGFGCFKTQSVAAHVGELSALHEGPTAQQLLDNNDCVLLATGATLARDLQQVKGRDLSGVHLAMEYLSQNTKALLDGGDVGKGWRRWWGTGASEKAKPLIDALNKHVVVIGGGDTGNDCIGTAVRQGATKVINLELMSKSPDLRASSNPWPHWPMVFKVDYGHEEAAPLNEGKDIRQYEVSTKEFVTDGSGKVTGLRVVGVKWERTGGGMKMIEVPGTEQVLKADLVLLALGFLGPEHPLAEEFGVDLDQRGNYRANYRHHEGDFITSNNRVFACGDCRRGQSLVVWAIKEGRDAADAIHTFLNKECEALPISEDA